MSASEPTAPRAADIRLDVEINDKESCVWLTDRYARKVPYRGKLSTVNLATRREALREGLTRFVKQVGPELLIGGAPPEPGKWLYRPGSWLYRRKSDKHRDEKWRIITQAVKTLYAQGQRLAEDLFGDDTPKVVTIFQDALRAAQTQNLEKVNNLPIIEVNARVDEFVPIELLMLLKKRPQTPESIKEQKELDEALSPFVGFAHAVVRRNIGTAATPQVHQLPDNPRLPVKLFGHPKLWKAGQSLIRLKEDKWIELDDTQPKAGSVAPGKFPFHVADHLWIHDGRKFDGSSLGRPFQVQHFACHFEAGARNPDENSLILNAGEEFRVSLGSLKQCRQQKNFKRYMGAAYPLVFLNACGSAVVDPAGVTSFPEYLMEYGSCGFIGTEALVPEEVAEAFAEAFYESFLQRKPLGLAIQIAKRRLVAYRQNPLGILYTVYANPDITVLEGNVPR